VTFGGGGELGLRPRAVPHLDLLRLRIRRRHGEPLRRPRRRRRSPACGSHGTNGSFTSGTAIASPIFGTGTGSTTGSGGGSGIAIAPIAISGGSGGTSIGVTIRRASTGPAFWHSTCPGGRWKVVNGPVV
jgi:hypothetical protein